MASSEQRELVSSPTAAGFCDGNSPTHPDGLCNVRARDPRPGAEEGTGLREKCLDHSPHGMSVLGGGSRFSPWQENFKANIVPVHRALIWEPCELEPVMTLASQISKLRLIQDHTAGRLGC